MQLSNWTFRRPFLASLCLLMAGFTTLSAQQAPALLNVSTRGKVGVGENILIAGLVIDGTAPRRVLFRVLGPSLANFGVSGAVNDPMISLFAGQEEIATNDNWETDADAAATARQFGFAPGSPLDCALVRTLAPGAYTAKVSGVDGATGVALVEAYDLDTATSTAPSLSRVLNLSTRGRVGVGDDVMIMGFYLSGTEPRDILINAIAGSLAEFGIGNALEDSSLTLFASNGTDVLAESDDWIDSPDFETIARSGNAPRDPLEAAVYVRLNPGLYTAVVRGVGDAQGVAIPELYELRSAANIAFAPTTLAARTATLVYSTGASPRNLDLAFTDEGVAAVGTGPAGTYTYTGLGDYQANLALQAGGHAITGSLKFYRTGIAVFEGTVQQPGGNTEDAGGILVVQ